MIFLRIFLKRIVSASDFFFKRLWPFCAPFSLAFIIVKALEKRQFFLDKKNSREKKQDKKHFNLSNSFTYILEGKTFNLSFPPPDILRKLLSHPSEICVCLSGQANCLLACAHSAVVYDTKNPRMCAPCPVPRRFFFETGLMLEKGE